MLITFILEIKKKNGIFYNPNMLAGMLRPIGRLIRARQEQRIVKTLVAPAVPFNIFTDVRYHQMKVDGDEAISRSSKAGLERATLKSDAISLSEEMQMLLSPEASPEIAQEWRCNQCYCSQSLVRFGCHCSASTEWRCTRCGCPWGSVGFEASWSNNNANSSSGISNFLDKRISDTNLLRLFEWQEYAHSLGYGWCELSNDQCSACNDFRGVGSNGVSGVDA